MAATKSEAFLRHNSESLGGDLPRVVPGGEEKAREGGGRSDGPMSYRHLSECWKTVSMKSGIW